MSKEDKYKEIIGTQQIVIEQLAKSLNILTELLSDQSPGEE